jgi:asparagine synthase (glutamine-hydrolysing)
VALSGDGADELFLGYGWHWKFWNTRKIVRLKNALFSNPFREHLKSITVFDEASRRALWKDSSAMQHESADFLVTTSARSGLDKINQYDLTTYLPGQLLTKIDRASMMHSLEVRCPFLDYQLAEYVYNLPETYKTDKKSGKIILKDILSEIMPKKFVYRRKQGFGAPVKEWLETSAMRSFVEKTLSSNARLHTFLKQEEVGRLLESFYSGKEPGVFYRIWVLLCLELWLQSH